MIPPPGIPVSSARALTACFVINLVASAGLAEENPSWRVAQGEVRVVCPMTIGGSFEAKTLSLAGTLVVTTGRPAAFTGELSVDLRSLDSGIGLRNDHLRDEYLEVGKGEGFDKAVLSGIHLGDADAETFQGRTRFSGNFALHGAKQPIAGQAEIRRDPAGVHVEASFPVTLADYGISKPQYLGVGVKGVVQVRVSLVATPLATSAGGAR
jgi:polyisoprenoid-binding protein YceI